MSTLNLPKYKCHKIVSAVQIYAIKHKPNPDTSGTSAATSYGAFIVPVHPHVPFEVPAGYVSKHNPQAGGYYVIYDDGYASFSPAAAFEAGYAPVPTDHRERMNVEHADLADKLARLVLFIGSDKFNTMPSAERYRMQEQRFAMSHYLDVLGKRIDAASADAGEPQLLIEDPDHAET